MILLTEQPVETKQAANSGPHGLAVRNLGDDCGGSSLAATPAPSSNVLLDKKNTNAFTFEDTLEAIPAGGVLIAPTRSGGPLDPLGKRSVDVWQADDLVAAVDFLKGRWLFITLTTARDMFLSPEHAYQRCNPRVSKVMATVCRRDYAAQGRRTYFIGCEVQGKTGEGWVHWHIMAYIPGSDTRTVEQIKADALKRWKIRTPHVDYETGEVTSRSIEPIGVPAAQHFEEARSAEGTARYICKYIVKKWPAVPPWLLNHEGRFRCMRFSNGAFDLLEDLHRHQRRRGSRPEPKGRIRPARTILSRMAASGASCNVFRREGAKLSWLCTLEVPVTEFQNLPARYGATFVRQPLGGWHKGRIAMTRQQFERLGGEVEAGLYLAKSEQYKLERLHAIAEAWNLSQGHDMSQCDEPDDADELELCDDALLGVKIPVVKPEKGPECGK